MKSYIQYLLLSSLLIASISSNIYPSDSDDETITEDVENENIYSKFMHNVHNNNTESVRHLLDNELLDPDYINLPNQDGFSALHYAAYNQNPEMIELLLHQGNANPNVVDDEGNTPLHVIADSNNIAAARKLLEYGADPFMKNKQNQEPVDCAKYTNMINLLNVRGRK